MNEINKDIALEKEVRSHNTSKERLRELATLNEDLAEIVASNIATSPELLVELAKHESKAIKKAITSNSNTPIETLLKLGEYFPQEFLNNPVFERLILENSKFLNNIPWIVWITLIQASNIPKSLYRYALNCKYGEVVNWAKMQVCISGEMTKGWHEAAENTIQRATYAKEYELFFMYGEDFRKLDITFVLLANFSEFVSSRVFNIRRFQELLVDNNAKKWSVSKEITNCNTAFRVYVAKNLDSQLSITIAENPDTPIHILENLAADSNKKVRMAVAKNYNTPVNILKMLAIDSDNEVRRRLAGNLSIPMKILEILANDSDTLVRISVVENTNAPVAILKKLANDSDDLVRLSVSTNSNCTHEIKEIIFKNFAKSEYPSFNRVALFLSDYAESSVLAENSNSISWLERYAIAQNKKTPEETLKQLAQDGNRIVRATAKESLQKYH